MFFRSFTGFRVSRISAKRNVILPSIWRSGLAVPMFIYRNQTFDLPIIELIDQDMLEVNLLETDPGSSLHEVYDHGTGSLSANYRQVHFGSRPRLTLPRTWCDESGIAYPGMLMVAGRGISIQFWSPENFQHMLSKSLKDIGSDPF
jgi:DNA-binding transcriptional regulator/RsmH inhibitor MraZ